VARPVAHQRESRGRESAIHQTGRVLDLGCGPEKVPGSLGLDRVRLPGVDVVADVTSGYLPFRDNSFESVHANHLLEHIHDLDGLLGEIDRITAPVGRIHVVVPYFTCVGAFGDPTHVRFFTYYTFDHFTDDPGRHTWFSSTRFTIRNRRIGFGRLFRLLGVEWWANRWPNIYENFFAYILPARTLTVELIVPEPQRDTGRQASKLEYHSY
jgi:SAM-dependent methyltransferase